MGWEERVTANASVVLAQSRPSGNICELSVTVPRPWNADGWGWSSKGSPDKGTAWTKAGLLTEQETHTFIPYLVGTDYGNMLGPRVSPLGPRVTAQLAPTSSADT